MTVRLERDEPLTPHVGSELLSELGFLHVPGPPLSANRAYLFVAVRRRPTLRHFDPERIDYWQTVDGRGGVASIDWRTRMPAQGEFAWGAIRIADRLNVINDFVGFGGTLAVKRSSDTLVAVFCSAAPILARGGQSQGWDPTSDEVATFFARLRAAAGESRAAEARLAQQQPQALYAAFVCVSLARYEMAERVAAWRPPALALLRRERSRLRRRVPAAWTAGEALARTLG